MQAVDLIVVSFGIIVFFFPSQKMLVKCSHQNVIGPIIGQATTKQLEITFVSHQNELKGCRCDLGIHYCPWLVFMPVLQLQLYNSC